MADSAGLALAIVFFLVLRGATGSRRARQARRA
jgi:hypothetical protein